jgi:hypothetical protein
VGCEGGEYNGGGGQRAYLRGPGEAGDTSWRWRRQRRTCQGRGTRDTCYRRRRRRRHSQAATGAQRRRGSARWPEARGPEPIAGGGWLKVKECRRDDVGDQTTETRTALTVTIFAGNPFS